MVNITKSCDQTDSRSLFTILALVIVLMCQVGCVHRRLTIRSQPPGALVYVDGVEVGRTPVSTPFIYYGTRTVRLELDGYESAQENHRLRAPWYQVPPLDFVSDNLISRDLHDERVLHFELVPMRVVPTDQLIQRAGELRKNAQLGVTATLPVVPSATQGFSPLSSARRAVAAPINLPANGLPERLPTLSANPARVDRGTAREPVQAAPQSPVWQYPGSAPWSARVPLQARMPSIQDSP